MEILKLTEYIAGECEPNYAIYFNRLHKKVHFSSVFANLGFVAGKELVFFKHQDPKFTVMAIAQDYEKGNKISPKNGDFSYTCAKLFKHLDIAFQPSSDKWVKRGDDNGNPIKGERGFKIIPEIIKFIDSKEKERQGFLLNFDEYIWVDE